MAATRVRKVVGRSHSICPLCRAEGDCLVLESRNRFRLPALFGGAAERRRYLVCAACGSRSELTGPVIDLRDPAS